MMYFGFGIILFKVEDINKTLVFNGFNIVHFSSSIIGMSMLTSFTYIYFVQLSVRNELVYFYGDSKAIVINILFLIRFTLEENIEESRELPFDILSHTIQYTIFIYCNLGFVLFRFGLFL
ncbi:hypothetical protein OAL39_01915 [bacterium]|nr:hypothetical protein [bacterium]